MSAKRRAILMEIIEDDTVSTLDRLAALRELDRLGFGSDADGPLSLRQRMAQMSEHELDEAIEFFSDLPPQVEAVHVVRLCLGEDAGDGWYWSRAKVEQHYPEVLATITTLIEQRARELADREAIDAEIERQVLTGVRELADPDRRAEEIAAQARVLAEQWTRDRMHLASLGVQTPQRAFEPPRELQNAHSGALALPAASSAPVRRGLRGGFDRR